MFRIRYKNSYYDIFIQRKFMLSQSFFNFIGPFTFTQDCGQCYFI